VGDVVFWGPTNPPDVDPDPNDIEHTVTISDRLDLIASRRMGDEQLGWIIMLRNNLRLVPNDLVPGMKIYIPTRESLQARGIIRQ
jgi:hypothetical protein